MAFGAPPGHGPPDRRAPTPPASGAAACAPLVPVTSSQHPAGARGRPEARPTQRVPPRTHYPNPARPSWVRLLWREPGIGGVRPAVVVAAERAAAMVMARVTLPGVHVTFPGVPLAAVVPAAPPAAGSRRPGRDLRGGSGLHGGSGARGYPLSTAEPGSTTI
jgi:hypothetical protein